MSRNILDVIDKMIEVTSRENLKYALEHIREGAKFTAPEAMYIRWDETSIALQQIIPPSKSLTDEDIKVLSIFSEVDEEIIKEKIQNV